ncbi:MAG: hypothetical protein LQ340_002072 [Diploschistes diacapsis]|nr:MAG: hypothetical protein LQ340_002072 [Diploschistes diacapsis]
MQIVQFLELVAACLLYLRPFLEALTSGFINGDDLRRRGQIKPYVIVTDDLAVNLVKDSGSDGAEAAQSSTLSGPRRAARDRMSLTTGMNINASSDEEKTLARSSSFNFSTNENEGPRTQSGGSKEISERSHGDGASQRMESRQYPAMPDSSPMHSQLPRMSTVYSTPLGETEALRGYIVEDD